MTSDEHDAQDIAQEAVVRAWRRRSTIRSATDQPAWLAAITRNEGRRLLSRRTATVTVEDVAAVDLEVAPHARAVQMLDVRSALQRLDPLDRTIALLRYREDLTQPKIAQVLGMPEGTIKVRLHRLRHKLRDSLTSP
jgi:RNA polymerase sigma-70 factor (ECF subfamily)